MLKLWSFLLFSLVFSPAITANAKNNKTLIYCSEGSPDYFNPQLSLSGAAFDSSNLLYSRLVEFNQARTQLIPGLAVRWNISKGKKKYTFHLRKKVSFSGGKDFKPSRHFNADDVVFSFERQKDKTHPYYQVNGGGYKFFHSLDLHNLITKIHKVTDHKVEFHLKQPHPLFLTYLAMEFAVILSKEYGDFLLQKGKKEQMDFQPVGTGPFVLKKYVKDSLIRYERNNNYYLGSAKLKNIVFAITPDPTVRFQKLKRKECHLLAKPQPVDIPAMKKHPDIQVAEGMTYNVAYLAMNTTRPPLNNVKVRQAIAHAFNRSLYIQAIYKGMAKLAHTPVPPNLWGHNKKIKSYEYNVKKAKELLKEAGYEKGLNLELWTLPISRPYNPNGKKMGELMQADLKKVGITVRLITYDWSTYIAKSSKGEHDLVQMGWSADIGDPGNFLNILLSCKTVDSGANLSRWCNKNYEKLIDQALKEFSQKKREPLYKKAQLVFHKASPWVPLVHAYGFSAFLKDVKGYQLKPFGSERFYHLGFSK